MLCQIQAVNSWRRGSPSLLGIHSEKWVSERASERVSEWVSEWAIIHILILSSDDDDDDDRDDDIDVGSW